MLNKLHSFKTLHPQHYKLSSLFQVEIYKMYITSSGVAPPFGQSVKMLIDDICGLFGETAAFVFPLLHMDKGKYLLSPWLITKFSIKYF